MNFRLLFVIGGLAVAGGEGQESKKKEGSFFHG
jgi:hypothetical protein